MKLKVKSTLENKMTQNFRISEPKTAQKLQLLLPLWRLTEMMEKLTREKWKLRILSS